MNLQESGEMYLETILVLKNRKGAVRSIDVANEMGYSKPSISRAVSHLREGGYLDMDEDGYLTLTPSGLEVASKIYDRHNVLSRMLMYLGVDEKTAVEDACRMEHVISDTSFDIIKEHLRKDGVID